MRVVHKSPALSAASYLVPLTQRRVHSIRFQGEASWVTDTVVSSLEDHRSRITQAVSQLQGDAVKGNYQILLSAVSTYRIVNPAKITKVERPGWLNPAALQYRYQLWRRGTPQDVHLITYDTGYKVLVPDQSYVELRRKNSQDGPHPELRDDIALLKQAILDTIGKLDNALSLSLAKSLLANGMYEPIPTDLKTELFTRIDARIQTLDTKR